MTCRPDGRRACSTTRTSTIARPPTAEVERRRDHVVSSGVAAHPKTCACAKCGVPTALRDFAYQLPDCIWAQRESQRSSRNSGDFAELDERRFVRGLLPVKLENGEEFRYGVWLEVDRTTFDEVRSSWNDEVRYPELRFAAKIANAAPPWRKRILGVEVDVGVRDQKSRPFVVAARERWLQRVIERGWTAAEYDAAVESFR